MVDVTGIERLARWMLRSQQPTPYCLELDHPAQEDIAWAGDEIQRLRARIAELQQENERLREQRNELIERINDAGGNPDHIDLEWMYDQAGDNVSEG